jgi:CBS domain containing-hemolysin-like protein
VIISLTAVATGVLRLLRIEPVSEIGDAPNRDAVAALIGESREEGLLQPDQHDLLSGALAFEELNANAVRLPLDTLITVTPDVTPVRIEELVAATGFSRFPVKVQGGDESGAGELIGYIHLADVLDTDPVRRHRPIDRRWIRPLNDVPTTATLQTVLASLRRSGSHLARVVDENGQTQGVIALEDVLEQIVGEVADSTRLRDLG